MIQTLFGSLEEEKKTGFLDRMKQAVTRTRENLAERIEEVVSFGKEIDANTLDDLEATLIAADLGNTTTQEVLGKLREKADRKQIKDVQELKRLLKEELLAILNAANTRPVSKVDGSPEVILVVGVNGTGKTTTIGKLSQVFRSQGKNVLLCVAVCRHLSPFKIKSCVRRSLSWYPMAEMKNLSPGSESVAGRCLGLVGGLGVGATIHYYRELAKAHAARGCALNTVILHADIGFLMKLVTRSEEHTSELQS